MFAILGTLTKKRENCTRRISTVTKETGIEFSEQRKEESKRKLAISFLSFWRWNKSLLSYRCWEPLTADMPNDVQKLTISESHKISCVLRNRPVAYLERNHRSKLAIVAIIIMIFYMAAAANSL